MNQLIKVVAILLVFSIFFGCINLSDDSIQKMNILQQKYFVKQGYSTNQATMTEYITSLANLRKTASNENSKVIEAEIYLAESFAYENRALSESLKLNYVAYNCSSTEAKAMTNYINLAFNSINLAEKSFSTLNSTQKANLRSNYNELLVGYKEKITMMKTFAESKC